MAKAKGTAQNADDEVQMKAAAAQLPEPQEAIPAGEREAAEKLPEFAEIKERGFWRRYRESHR